MGAVTLDPRILTGPAFVLIGTLFLWISGRLWLVHPINRVFRVGPFVTEEGMAALLNMRPIFLSYGLLGVTSGIYRCTYWFVTQSVNAPVILFLGSLETGFAVWAAILSIMAAVRLWRAR